MSQAPAKRKQRAAATRNVKTAITVASVAATVGGWAALSVADGASSAAAAPVPQTYRAAPRRTREPLYAAAHAPQRAAVVLRIGRAVHRAAARLRRVVRRANPQPGRIVERAVARAGGAHALVALRRRVAITDGRTDFPRHGLRDEGGAGRRWAARPARAGPGARLVRGLGGGAEPVPARQRIEPPERPRRAYRARERGAVGRAPGRARGRAPHGRAGYADGAGRAGGGGL